MNYSRLMRRFGGLALVIGVTLAVAGCTPGVDRASLATRGDYLVASVREVPDVLDAVIGRQEEGVNSAPLFVRIDFEAGETRITDAIVAVRDTMAGSDFELFSLEVQIDDAQELPYGATISWSGLPKEDAIREEVAVWFDLLSATPLLGLSYLVNFSGIGSDVVVRATGAVRPDGSVATDQEVEEALVAAWVAAGRDSETLGVVP